MKVDKARADLANIKKDAELATLQAADLAVRAEELERTAATLRQKSLLLEAFIKDYGDPEPAEVRPVAAAPEADEPLEKAPSPAVSAAAPLPAERSHKAPRTRTKVTPEILDAILSQRAQGLKMADIATNVGVSVATVNNYIRAHRGGASNGGDNAATAPAEQAQPNMLESY